MTGTRAAAAPKCFLLRRAPGPSLSFQAGSAQDLPIRPVPRKALGLAQRGTRDSLFLQISFSNFPSISPINSEKGKSKQHNTEAWERSGSPASKLFPNTTGRCVCTHDNNPNCWVNWEPTLTTPSPPEEGPLGSVLGSRVPTPPARQPAWCEMAPGDAGKQLPAADHGAGCDAYAPGWLRSHISRC